MPAQGYWGAARPPGGTPLDAGHHLAQGVTGLWTMSEGAGAPASAVGRFLAPPIGAGVQWRATGHGSSPSLVATAGSTDNTIVLAAQSALVLPLQGATLAVGLRKRDATPRNGQTVGVVTGTGNQRCSCSLPYGDGNAYWDWGGTSNGTTRLTVAGLTFGLLDNLFVMTTGARGMEMWQNGVLRGSNAANPSRLVSTGALVAGFNSALGDGADLVDYWYVGVWSRQLTVAEVQALTAQPYAMFAAPVWRRYGESADTPPAGIAGGRRTLLGVGG